jgi:predicted type IV restriction endonuclease
VTTEYKIRGQYADYGIRINDKICAFIEVKAINIALNQNHLFQVASYAVHEGVDWAILTNGNVWQLYRIEDTKPIKLALVTSIDLFDKELRFPAKCLAFAAFHKKSLVSKYIDKLWKEKSCVNPETVRRIITSKQGVEFIRKQIRRQSGYRVEASQVSVILTDMFSGIWSDSFDY